MESGDSRWYNTKLWVLLVAVSTFTRMEFTLRAVLFNSCVARLMASRRTVSSDFENMNPSAILKMTKAKSTIQILSLADRERRIYCIGLIIIDKLRVYYSLISCSYFTSCFSILHSSIRRLASFTMSGRSRNSRFPDCLSTCRRNTS